MTNEDSVGEGAKDTELKLALVTCPTDRPQRWVTRRERMLMVSSVSTASKSSLRASVYTTPVVSASG